MTKDPSFLINTTEIYSSNKHLDGKRVGFFLEWIKNMIFANGFLLLHPLTSLIQTLYWRYQL